MATVYTPKSKVSGTKYGKITGNSTSAQELMVLPKDAIISGVYIYGAAVASSATTLTAAVGSDADGLLVAYDLVANGLGYNAAGAATGAQFGQKLTVDSKVTGTLSAAVAGDASKTWTVKVEYVMPGSGETLTS
jgi:hypothetical protein